MLKNTVMAALIAASSLIVLPSSAGAQDRPPKPPCSLNCAWISTDHDGNGYWICDVQMDCVE